MTRQDADRYERAAHAVQSGVAAEQSRGSEDGTPKHLRVGIVLRRCESAVLARVLIAAGLLTEDGYIAMLADEVEKEVAEYEERLSDAIGAQVKLQ
jgi:hypothetical protein